MGRGEVSDRRRGLRHSKFSNCGNGKESAKEPKRPVGEQAQESSAR